MEWQKLGFISWLIKPLQLGLEVDHWSFNYQGLSICRCWNKKYTFNISVVLKATYFDHKLNNITKQSLTLNQVVLKRSSSQYHSSPGLNGIHGFGHGWGFILQHMALITNNKVWTCNVTLKQKKKKMGQDADESCYKPPKTCCATSRQSLSVFTLLLFFFLQPWSCLLTWADLASRSLIHLLRWWSGVQGLVNF